MSEALIKQLSHMPFPSSRFPMPIVLNFLRNEICFFCQKQGVPVESLRFEPGNFLRSQRWMYMYGWYYCENCKDLAIKTKDQWCNTTVYNTYLRPLCFDEKTNEKKKLEDCKRVKVKRMNGDIDDDWILDPSFPYCLLDAKDKVRVFHDDSDDEDAYPDLPVLTPQHELRYKIRVLKPSHDVTKPIYLEELLTMNPEILSCVKAV